MFIWVLGEGGGVRVVMGQKNDIREEEMREGEAFGGFCSAFLQFDKGGLRKSP